MPNHVTTKLIVQHNNTPEGEQEIKQFHELVTSPGIDWRPGHFDFNRIKPMPEELHDTTSPRTVIEDWKDKLESIKERYPFLFADDYKQGEEERQKSINYHLRNTLHLSEAEDLIDRLGTTNRYGRSINHRWTKRNTYTNVIHEEWFYEFQTARSMPEPVIKYLSTKFNNLIIVAMYADEDYGSNCGGFALYRWIEIRDFDAAYLYAKFLIHGEDYQDMDWFDELEYNIEQAFPKEEASETVES
jgi:hypothetical protein